ncbi:hypothetical protein JVY00_06675 [Tsukamurella tyrosinosolvens]|uniref:hypothetical protein n=1 Tax=Tsukamurella tyrosinosolvens TaxID=57704 RepID=UPI001AF7EFF2|nr:hypothetical protein [Tsukamurella tyrosinosolvens]QRY85750.1 hypothetical protein JVY00_06675 [Tsukamurella tyrosinosolvens]
MSGPSVSTCPAARRPLPAGFDVPDHPYSVPPVLRSYYQCVSVPPAHPVGSAAELARHERTVELAAEWAIDDRTRRHGPGAAPRHCATCARECFAPADRRVSCPHCGTTM